jgi:hypothetical protein
MKSLGPSCYQTKELTTELTQESLGAQKISVEATANAFCTLFERAYHAFRRLGCYQNKEKILREANNAVMTKLEAI